MAQRVNEKPKVIFVLVHGTFNKNADWVSNADDPLLFRSKLKAALEGEYDVVFDDTFSWGHDGLRFYRDNRVDTRLKGAEGLRAHLRDAPDRGSTARYIVAHSHGGNVALYALRDPDTRKRVDGLVCLATPFLHSKHRAFRIDTLVYTAVALLIFSIGATTRWGLPYSAGVWIYTAVFCLLALRLATSGFLPTTNEAVKRIALHCDALEFPHCDEFSGKPGKLSLWAFRVDDDEVNWAMKLAHRLGRWFRDWWRVVNVVGGRVMLFSIVILFPSRIVVDKLDLGSGLIDMILLTLDRLVTPLLILGSFILLAMACLRLIFAFDALRWLGGVDTWSSEAPWEGLETIPVELDPNTKGLWRHTRVQGPSVEYIADRVRAAHPLT